MLMLGGIEVFQRHNGEIIRQEVSPQVFIFTNRNGYAEWIQLDDLKKVWENLYNIHLIFLKPVAFGSVFFLGSLSSVYLFPGLGGENGEVIQRIYSEGNGLKSTIIGTHTTDYLVPVVYHAESDFCV